MSKRQQIIDRIIERMQTIRVDNGYQTDLGLRVEDWRVNWDEEDFPALSVCDLITEEDFVNGQPTAALQTNKLPVQFRIFHSSASEIRKLEADVKKAIKVDPRWGGLALHTRPAQAGIIVPEQAFEIAGGAVNIEIEYLTATFES